MSIPSYDSDLILFIFNYTYVYVYVRVNYLKDTIIQLLTEVY